MTMSWSAMMEDEANGQDEWEGRCGTIRKFIWLWWHAAYGQQQHQCRQQRASGGHQT
jgi:hypothetical protein